MGSLAYARANIKSAGISNWYIKAHGDIGHYDLGELQNASINIKSIDSVDTKGIAHTVGYEIEAKATLMRASDTLMNLFETLASNDIESDIVMTGGGYVTMPLTATPRGGGFSLRYVNDNDMSGDCYVEIVARRRIKASLFNSFVLSTTFVPTGAQVADMLYALSTTPAYADIKIAGIQKVEVSATGAASWESLGVIRSGKFIAECQDYVDTSGRNIPKNIKCSLSVEMLQTAAASELADIDGVSIRQNDYKVTFENGTVLTFTLQLGLAFNLRVDGNLDGERIITVNGDGILTLAQFTTLWP